MREQQRAGRERERVERGEGKVEEGKEEREKLKRIQCVCVRRVDGRMRFVELLKLLTNFEL